MSGGGYKRRVRVLFVSGGGFTAAAAAAVANEEHPRWFEARAAALDPRPFDAGETGALSDAALATHAPERFGPRCCAWADLVVALDAESDAACIDLPPGRQKRCYPRPDAAQSGPCSPAERIALVRRRIEGMAGGLAMMQRAGDGGHPDAAGSGVPSAGIIDTKESPEGGLK